MEDFSMSQNMLPITGTDETYLGLLWHSTAEHAQTQISLRPLCRDNICLVYQILEKRKPDWVFMSLGMLHMVIPTIRPIRLRHSHTGSHKTHQPPRYSIPQLLALSLTNTIAVSILTAARTNGLHSPNIPLAPVLPA